MASIAASYEHTGEKGSIPRLCRPLIGDWIDVPDKRSGKPMTLHVTFKAHGNEVVGSLHVRPANAWLRMKVTSGWFCAKGLVYERRGGAFSHVATVRLCHRKKDRSVLWQVTGPDQSGCLPHEAVLWPHHQ